MFFFILYFNVTHEQFFQIVKMSVLLEIRIPSLLRCISEQEDKFGNSTVLYCVTVTRPQNSVIPCRLTNFRRRVLRACFV